MSDIVSHVIPIILLIALGYFIKCKQILDESMLEGMKKIVLNISLPAILFITFINMDIKKEHFLIMFLTLALLCVFYFVGEVVNKIKFLSHPLNPFISTGFCFGLLGIPLFGTVFGTENLGKISIFGVGHEIFIWFVYYNLVKIKLTHEKLSFKVVLDFFTSPLLLSIILGVLFNLLGFGECFKVNPLLKGIFTTIQYISNLGTPLILIIIGYDLKFNKKYMKQSIIFVITRMIIILAIGYGFKFLVLDKIIASDTMFNYAYFTFLILPIPFSLPIFVSEYGTNEDKELINNAVVLSTAVCIIVFIAFVMTI
ncbi:AEC family transporter [Clostridium botulinum]|uniref:Malate permease n=1 Tax=Clostridium botulinum TaxID=1491 RepID=A0A9Q1UW41_CLOBO|nr:AEC family transporter [Clostridium botulinum]AEB74980.1 putative malate permease [Clostridium botulinum BKT015925]KEI02249.1 malate permease [Clostridium botulinum C/D str. Sp77]KEI03634.1 malate permease [Clostridium botulinum D str. 16868]KLU77068.1 malate permease [Clostridium botulinum V891]KOA74185.1 malate permease [Clostridium botulinum]